MFDSFRQSLRELMDRATPPEERRAGLARMKQTLVTARMGLEDLRTGVALTRQRLAREQQELETMRRRKGLAAGIEDAETLALAEKYEAHHAERAGVLARKLEAQEAELAIAERDVAEMTTELRNAVAGIPGAPSRAASIDAEAEGEVDDITRDRGPDVAAEIDALGRASARTAREADAEARLAELKRRMGK
jgi:acyl CoA:acetate/3-ketoacid CoA transferase alpha subunit